MNKWTKNQQAAIDSKKSTLVSASAGTGKTAVLTERVCRQLLNGVDISKILVMTFSHQAADEMKKRIINKINEAIETEKESTSRTRIAKLKILYNQLNEINSAPIQTIHSFCLDIIKRYYYLVDLDPKFRVASSADTAVLKQQAAKNVLETEYDNELFNFLYDYVDKNNPIESTIISAHNSLMSIFDGYAWLSKEVEKYDIDENTIPDQIKSFLIADFEKAVNMLEDVKESLDFYADEKIKKMISVVSTDINVLKTAIEYVNKDNIAGINPYLFAPFGAMIRFPDSCLEEKQLRSDAKDIIAPYKTSFYMDRQLKRIKSMYPLAKYFESLLKKFNDEYSKLKAEKNIIDFSDMEQYAYKILSVDKISENYKNSFFAVYVDEYQDTSPIQEAIIRAVSTDQNLFCVGDLKQSIYRFRSSDPILFSSRMNKYNADKTKTVISLNDNFRSSANVLNCANDIFKIISRASSEIKYDKNDYLNHGRNDLRVEAPVKLRILSPLNDDKKNFNKDELEIAAMAQIIKERVGKPVYDASLNAMRPASYRDITILSRKVLKYTDRFNKIFAANNIPFEIEKNGDLFETDEIKILISLLQLIINRNNDLNIISIMHNGLFGFNDDDILNIRNYNLDDSYINNMKEIAGQNTGSLSEKCTDFLNFLTLCNEKQHLYSLQRLVSYVIDRAYLNDLFAIRENGQHRIENLKLFVTFAAEFDHKNHGKIYAFLKYIAEIQDSSETVGEASTVSTSDNVKITTIHKSKGLEYPIVILAFMGKEFSDISQRSSIILDRDAGLGLKYMNSESYEKGKNLYRSYIERIVATKNKEEEMRLLYVAMTRAKEELYIQGTNTAFCKDLNSCKSMNDWVIHSVLSAQTQEDGSTDFIKSGQLKGNWDVEFVDMDTLKPLVCPPVPERNNPSSKIPFNIPPKKHIERTQPIPKSISASNFSHATEFTRDSFEIPDFMKQTTAAKRGDSVHKFLRYVNLTHGITMNEIRSQIDDLCEKGILTPEDRNNISNRIIFGITAITKSEFFDEYMMSSNILKEQNFYTYMNSSEISSLSNGDDSHEVLVRCIVDMAYETDDGFVIVDYKTDKVTTETLPDAINRHRGQLEIYKKCIESTYNKPVKSMYLVMLSAGKSYKI